MNTRSDLPSPNPHWSRLAHLTVLVAAVIGVTGSLGAAPVEATGPVAAQAEESTLSWSVRPTPTDAEPDRPNFSYDIEPGDTITDSVRVRNYATEPLLVDLYASDAITTSTGALDLLPAGEVSTDVGAWITVDESELDVPAQDFIDVEFTLTVPADAEPGDHTGGIVTSHRTPGVDDDGEAVVLDRRLGSRVHVRVDGPLQPQLEISDLEVTYSGTANPIGTGTVHATYTVTNTGNVRLGADQTVSAAGRFGFPGRTVAPVPMGELLPGNSLTFDVDIADVWPTVRTTTEIELTPVPTRDGDVFAADTPTATATATTATMPWTLLAVLIVAIAAPLLWRWRRRRRKRREAALVGKAVKEALADQHTGTPPDADATDTDQTATHRAPTDAPVAGDADATPAKASSSTSPDNN